MYNYSYICSQTYIPIVSHVDDEGQVHLLTFSYAFLQEVSLSSATGIEPYQDKIVSHKQIDRDR